MDSITLGSTPCSETCAQVGAIAYEPQSIRECRVFKRMLERTRPVPDGVCAAYRIKSFEHDFGRYREVTIEFDGSDAKATEFAFGMERTTPEHWDAVALAELLWYETRAVYARKLARAELDDEQVPVIYRTAAPPQLVSVSDLLRVELTAATSEAP